MKQYGFVWRMFVVLGSLTLFLLSCYQFVVPTRTESNAASLRLNSSLAVPMQMNVATNVAIPVSVTWQPFSPLLLSHSAIVTLPIPLPATSVAILSATFDTLRVALVSENKLKLWQKGTITVLADLDQPTPVKISEDGTLIAFQTSQGLWTIHSDRSNKKLQVNFNELKAQGPEGVEIELFNFAWLPHSHMLVFSTQASLDGINGDSGKKMFQSGIGGERFVPSPNGQWIALFTPNFIRLVDPKDGSARDLFEYPRIVVPNDAPHPFFIYPQLRWAADSSSLLVAIPPLDIFQKSYLPTAIWRLTFAGAQPTFVTAFIASPFGLSIAPDLTKVLFFRMSPQFTEGVEAYDLHIIALDHTYDITYATSDGAEAIWSPDSKNFAFKRLVSGDYMLGKVGTEPSFFLDWRQRPGEVRRGNLTSIAWLDAQHFLYTEQQGQTFALRLGMIGQSSILLAGPEPHWITFDYTLAPTT